MDVYVLLRFVGLALLFWVHPMVAGVLLVLLCTINGSSYKGWALVKNTLLRLMIETMASIAAAIGFWKFPHFHPIIGQLLATGTILSLIGTIIVFFTSWNNRRLGNIE